LLSLADAILSFNPKIHTPFIITDSFHGNRKNFFIQHTEKLFSDPAPFIPVAQFVRQSARLEAHSILPP
jgi:hypothetical protein